MRWSQNPYPRRSKEEEQLWVQTQKAKRGMGNIFPKASSHANAAGNGLAALMPFVLIFVIVAAVPLYLAWFIREFRTYPSSRRTLLKQELLRVSVFSSIALVLYAVIDALFLKNHVYLSLLAMPTGVWLSWYANGKLRVASKTQKYENHKWVARRRRKLAKQQAREQKKAA